MAIGLFDDRCTGISPVAVVDVANRALVDDLGHMRVAANDSIDAEVASAVDRASFEIAQRGNTALDSVLDSTCERVIRGPAPRSDLIPRGIYHHESFDECINQHASR